MLAMAPIAFLGFLEVSTGNHVAALAVLQPVLEPLLSLLDAAPLRAEMAGNVWVPDVVEAMIGVGRLAETEPLIEWLERDGLRLEPRLDAVRRESLPGNAIRGPRRPSVGRRTRLGRA
jgi:hypothetical protein